MITDVLNRDAREFWEQLRAERNANPPKPREIVVEIEHKVETEKIVVPEDEIIVTPTLSAS